MSEINSSNFKKEHGDLAPDLVGVTELTSPYFFVPPSGDTASRPEDCEPGTLRFNTDSGTLEIFRGKTIGWEQIQRRDSQYLGGGTGSNAGTGTRAAFAGGYTGPSPYPTGDTIDFITVSTFGDAQDVGNLSNAGTVTHACASSTRTVINVTTTSSPQHSNTMEYVTIMSTGNSIDFGDLTTNNLWGRGGSSDVHGGVG